VGNKKLRFDGWVVDPESGDLERAGTRLRLQEQPMLVLQELIAHAGDVVTREHLIALLWPKGVVDFDTGLNTAVRKLRSALGDTAETPRYIETLPRRGYRFIVPVDPEPDALATGGPPATLPTDTPAPLDAGAPTATATPRARPARLWLSIAILVAAGAAVWFAVEFNHRSHNPLANAKITRLTGLSGKEQSAEISRDGKMAVFLSDHDGHTDVWITEIGSGNYRNMTRGNIREIANSSIRTLGFSADGSLVTIWERQPEGPRSGDVNILAVPTNGGAVRPYLPEAAEVSWSSDGSRIVYHTSAPGDPLFVRDLRQSSARRIYAAEAGVHCHFPIWSPGDEFIYFVRGVPLEAWDVWRIRPTGSDLERITFQNAQVSHPVLLDSRTLVYLATDAERSGPWLYVTDVKERVPRRISFGLERYTSLAASADGGRLVATVANPRTSLWSLAILGDGAVQAKAVRISPESATELSPRLGPNYLLFVSYKGGRAGIVKRVDGANKDLWSNAHGTIVGAPAIAPNGRIAFTVSDGTKTLLYAMESDGSQVRVVTDSLRLRGNPAWAPDGQSIVSAVTENGEPRLAIIPISGASSIPLVSEYSLDPVWSPDGRFLLYSGADLGMMFPLRAVAGDGKLYGGLLAPVLTRGARRVVFWRDGQAIVVLRGEIGHKNFWLVDLKNGAERQLTDLPSEFDIRDFDVSPDGNQIIFDRTEENSEIAVIERAA
jgi:Tol biopolymer transport system component/DNA-binding winged helix-turn-helix (wHTH) protein